ncbi:hypothetical protein HYALB_00007644 [Hymenoscyphus albidus]|uniref:Uncharacterized protein n=1 Tax=Hymenoscyphus albidus TaxID=595503 RepID=A0A9N9LED5_9HELO|nr:hypothetical protein HYALB_00007644 [Hymenoscyphus albidus]
MTDKHQRYKGRDMSDYATFLGETMDTDDEASAAFGADVEACGDATPISSSSVWADQPSSSILNAAGMQGNPGVARHDFDTVVYARSSPSSKLIKPEFVTTQELIAARSRNEFGEMSQGEPRPIKMEPQDEVFLYDIPVDNDHENDDGALLPDAQNYRSADSAMSDLVSFGELDLATAGMEKRKFSEENPGIPKGQKPTNSEDPRASDETRDPDVTLSMPNAADVASRLKESEILASPQTRRLKRLRTTDPASSEADVASRKKSMSESSCSESDVAPRKKKKTSKKAGSGDFDRDPDSGIDDKEIPDIEVVYDEYWTEQDEQTLRDDFQDPDESVCNDGMFSLIRKTGARFGMMSFDLVPEGGIPQTASSQFFLKYCLAFARYNRLGKEHLKPSTDDLDLDENSLVAKFKKNVRQITGDREVDAGYLKAFKKTLNLVSQRPTHFKMAKVLKGLKVAIPRHKGANAEAITKGDLDRICKAWDDYATKSRDSSLQLMQDIPDIALARGPSKKGQNKHQAIAREKHIQWLLNRERISRRATNESTR